MKTLTFQASLPQPDDTQSMVTNLRQSYPEATLQPVVPPHRICPFETEIITSLNNPDGTATHFLQTSSLRILAANSDAIDRLVEIGQLQSRVNAVFTSTDGMRLLTDEGSYLIFRNSRDEWVLRPLSLQFPAVAIRPTAIRPATAYTAACSLSGTYTSWGTAFSKADITMLGNNLTAALRAASSSLLADGCHIAPLLAWYRLRDASGNVIFRSMPTVVTPEGIQGPAYVDTSVAVSGGAYRSVAAAPVKVNGYKIMLATDPSLLSATHRTATSLELMTVPAIDLLDYSATARLTCLAHTTTEATLRMEIPRLPRHSAILPAMIDRIDELSSVSAVLFDPFAPDSPLLTGWTPEIAAESMPGDSQTEIATALKRKPEAAALHPIMRETALPHSLSAAEAMTAGDIVALAGITPIHALPMPLQSICSTGSSRGPWQAKICISLINADGATERLCAESSGDGPIPDKLLPLIAYPHPGAFRCDIELTTASHGSVGASFPMIPTPAGLQSCYIAPSLRPVAFSSMEPSASPLRAVTERAPVSHPSLLMIADTHDPLSPRNAIDIAGSAIHALSPAPRSSSGLAFGRRHIYAFTAGGIHAVSINEKRSMAASLIDTSPVTSRSAIASAGNTLYAATPSAIVKIDGSRVTPVMRGAYSAIGYNKVFRELWCLRTPGFTAPDDPGTLTLLDRCEHVFTRTDIQPKTLLQTPAALLAVTPDGVYDTSFEEIGAAPDMPVSWARRISLATGSVPRVTGLSAIMASENALINLDLLGDNGADAAGAALRPRDGASPSLPANDPDRPPHRFAGISAAGEIAASLYLPVLAHPHRYVTIRLSGIVDPLTTISAFHMSVVPFPL